MRERDAPQRTHPVSAEEDPGESDAAARALYRCAPSTLPSRSNCFATAKLSATLHGRASAIRWLIQVAYVLGRMGRTTEARELLGDLEQATRPIPPYEIAAVQSGLGNANRAFAWLEKAYAARDANLVFLPVDPKIDPIRGDARFPALPDRCGFTRLR